MNRSGVEQEKHRTVLSLATRTLGAGPSSSFADALSKASGRRLTIGIDSHMHRNLGRRSEAAILEDVASGAVALGLVSVESLQAAGVHSLDPLVAPGVVTTVDLEANIAGGPLATTMLAGVSKASVVGVAIVPGPINHLVGVGRPVDGASQLSGRRVGVWALANQAEELFSALGAVTVLDNRIDPVAGARAVDASPGAISRRPISEPADHVMGNLPLWPDPSIVVMNREAFRHLSRHDRQLVLKAGLGSAATAGELVSTDEAAASSSLCADGRISFATMPDAGLASVRSGFQHVTDEIRHDAEAGPVLAKIELDAAAATLPAPLGCVTPGNRPDSHALPLVGPARTLIGHWSADVTQQALNKAGQLPTEQGETGRIRLTFTASGHAAISNGDGLRLAAEIAVDGDVMEMTPATDSTQQGSGEHWRFRWSVFKNVLTLRRFPGAPFVGGPTALISQPFDRTTK